MVKGKEAEGQLRLSWKTVTVGGGGDEKRVADLINVRRELGWGVARDGEGWYLTGWSFKSMVRIGQTLQPGLRE